MMLTYTLRADSNAVPVLYFYDFSFSAFDFAGFAAGSREDTTDTKHSLLSRRV